MQKRAPTGSRRRRIAHHTKQGALIQPQRMLLHGKPQKPGTNSSFSGALPKRWVFVCIITALKRVLAIFLMSKRGSDCSVQTPPHRSFWPFPSIHSRAEASGQANPTPSCGKGNLSLPSEPSHSPPVPSGSRRVLYKPATHK